MAETGSTLNFKKESAAFAKALQTEHGALGDLLADISATASANLSVKELSAEIVERAEKAHAGVRFQQARTEAARGRR